MVWRAKNSTMLRGPVTGGGRSRQPGICHKSVTALPMQDTSNGAKACMECIAANRHQSAVLCRLGRGGAASTHKALHVQRNGAKPRKTPQNPDKIRKSPSSILLDITIFHERSSGNCLSRKPAWFKSWVFQVTVRSVPVPQPGTLAVGSGASDEPVQADAGTRRPGPEAQPSRSRTADSAGRRLARPH